MSEQKTMAAPIERTASLGRRIIAFLIDIAIIGIANAIFDRTCRMLGFDDRAIFGMLHMLSIAAYFILFHHSRWQATLGKKLMYIRLERIDGGRMELARATTRYFILFAASWFSLMAAMINGENLFGPVIKPLSPSSNISTFTQKAQEAGEKPPTALDKAYEEIQQKMANNEPRTEQEDELLKSLNRNSFLEAFTPNMRGWVEVICLLYVAVIVITTLSNRRHIGLHDRICNTVVVKSPELRNG